MDNFIHLHVHSEYSLLDGACRLSELIDRAVELGQSSVAVTDHGCMYAAVDFYNMAHEKGVKPIIGCEVYVARRTMSDKNDKLDRKPYHLVLLCENNEGYQNLIKLVSIGYIDGFYNKPRVDVSVLEKYHKGLIALSGCLAGEIPVKLLNGDYDGAKQTAEDYRRIFGDCNYYLEVQDHGIPEQRTILPSLYKLSAETGIPLVATNDAHYILKEDAKVQRVLLAIQTGTVVGDENAMAFPNDEFYLKSYDEMAERFKFVPEALSNSVKIAERCNVTFEFGSIKLPKFEMEGVSDNYEFFRKSCFEGLEKRYPDGREILQKATERLEYELSVIKDMGYVDYFLIVWDFIHFAKEHGIPVGPGRGSGAGSIAAYCMGITDIDPLRYNLIFERFLNKERVSMPDFDIDFCYEGRQRVIDYVVSKYGSDRVAQIITFGTMAARGAVRDVGRAMGMPYAVVDSVAKLIPMEQNITLAKSLRETPELKKLYNSDEKVKELFDTASKVEGMPRHASTHAAGVVIAAAPVSEYVPLQKNDESIVTQYTMTNLEKLGLLKMDFLGLRTLTVIRDCENSIKKKEPKFSKDKIPDDDVQTFKMLSAGATTGVFQFESGGMRSMLARMEPQSIEDLIAAISLYRPGPMESIPKYIENKRNPDNITYFTPKLKSILDVTYGCIVYQEQVMEICRSLAGYTYGHADIVRRAMAKKKRDVMEKERDIFVNGAVRRGVTRDAALEIFMQMSTFASYAFNKSHAAAYASLAYTTAYLKCHYVKEYMAALLTSVLDNSSKIIEYISESECAGIKILNPSINESGEGFTPIRAGIRFALTAIKNLGRGTIRDIVKERTDNGYFSSLENFCKRMYGKDINKRAIESLIKSGAFDDFGENRREMLENYEMYFDSIGTAAKSNVDGQLDFFGNAPVTHEQRIATARYPEYPVDVLLAMEKEVIGIYISGHPVSKYTALARAAGLVSTKDIEEIKTDGVNVGVVLMFNSKKLHTTKQGERMCFINAEDETGTVEVITFPEIFRNCFKKIVDGDVLVVMGRTTVKDDEVKLIASDIYTGDEFEYLCMKKTLQIIIDSKDTERGKEISRLLQENRGVSDVIFVNQKKIYKNYCNISNWLISELVKILSDKNILLI